MLLYHVDPLSCLFTDEQTHLKSIRPKEGQILKITDLKGSIYKVKTTSYNFKTGLGSFEIIEKIKTTNYPKKILIQCITDKLYLEKMMEVLPLAKISEIELVYSEFSPKQSLNPERLKLILIRACEQSECHTLPLLKISDKTLLEFNFLENTTYLELPEKEQTIKNQDDLKKDWQQIIVGPEGGFSKNEILNFQNMNLKPSFIDCGVLPAWIAGYTYFIQN
jgi:16S rRNA (uracil1498-N3)-methyltransferase